jgi:DNA replication initiation complex subunit (GINS family)
VASLKEVSGRLEQGKSTLGKLLAEDDTMYRDLKSIVVSLKEVSGRLEQGKGLMGKLVADDDTLYNDLKETVEEVRATIDDLRETTPVVSFTSILFGAF